MSGIEMPYRRLGNCGMKVSALSLGGWTTYGGSIQDSKLVRKILTAAYEAGVNFFDIADVYANGAAERKMGKVLKDFARHTLVISSKVFFPYSDDVNDRGLSRKHIMESIERSLKNIGSDYLDLYFCHRFDEDTPLEETVRAMDDLVHQGKVLYWGISEWSGEQIDKVSHLCEHYGYYRPQVEQPRYNLLARKRFEEDVAPALDRHGMGAVTFSPLATGILTGKYDSGIPADSRLANEEWLREWMYKEEYLAPTRAFAKIAEAAGCSRTRLALAWALRHPTVSSVIMGATTVQQLKENLSALTLQPDEDVFARLEEHFRR